MSFLTYLSVRERPRYGRIEILLRIVVSLGLGCALRPAAAQGFAANPAYHTPRGPIPIRDARPLNLLFLQFVPETADVLPTRANRYDLQLDLINNMLIPDPRLGATVVEDNEYQRVRFAWRRGLGRGTEIGVFVPILWRNGGILDGIITAYHHLVGLPANADDVPLGRDHYPQYRSLLQIVDASGNVLVDQGNAFGLGETIVTLKRSLTRTTPRSALDLRLGLKLPTGNPTLALGSGSVDEGLSLDIRYSLGREILLYGNLGYVMMGPAIKIPGGRPNTVETLIAIEYRPNNRDSFVLQVDGNGQFVRTGNGFADRSNVTATFGYQRVLDRHLVGFLSFSEGGHIHNFTLPAFSNVSPDITVSTGLTWQP
jgi:hypothetical protein